VVRVYPANFERESIFSLDSLSKGAGWPEYIKDVARSLQKAEIALRGLEGPWLVMCLCTLALESELLPLSREICWASLVGP
jgi:hypothetical protein